MHVFTEKIGSYLPEDAHKIIKHRYQIASKLSKGKKVLEVGVGQGYGLQSIAKSAIKYTGIEYSSENIDHISNSKSKYRLIHGDAHNMPFHDSEFQVINALAMVYYLDIDKFFREAKRVLCLNGTLFFCTSNKDVPGFVEAPFTSRYYSIPELKELLIKNGFEADFYGSFAKYAGYEYFEKFKVSFRNIAKNIITLFPFGKRIWKTMRNRHLGGLKKLPSNLADIDMGMTYESNFNKLEDDTKDTQYRIIYCIARLINK